jgi:hypothetical protein
MMKTFKLQAILRIAGIIAMVAMVGFLMVACDDGDDNKSSGGDAFAKELQGTWVGDEDNGTLIITAKSVDVEKQGYSGAYTVASRISSLDIMTAAFGGVKGDKGKIYYKMSGDTTVVYTYSIAGSTLTIKDGDDVEFVGTK